MNLPGLLLPLLATILLASCAVSPLDCTVGKPAACELHRIEMTRTLVPIRYGFPPWNKKIEARHDASKRDFPNADDHVAGGCVVERRNPTQAMIFVCPDCQRKAQQWDSEHPKARQATTGSMGLYAR